MNRVNFRTETLLAAACLLAALLLGASELMELFRLTPPGGEAIEAIDAMDQHHGALIVLAVAAIIALGVAALTGSKPAAAAVAACGVIALLIFLVGDLPAYRIKLTGGGEAPGEKKGSFIDWSSRSS
jgi:hypothetical protein